MYTEQRPFPQESLGMIQRVISLADIVKEVHIKYFQQSPIQISGELAKPNRCKTTD